MGLLSLASAWPSCLPASLSQHPWVTGFSLAQSAVALLSSWVQVGPWQTESQVILHSGVLCVPGCNSQLSHWKKMMLDSPLIKGLNAEQISPRRPGAQMPVAGLHSFWVRVEPRRAMSLVIFYLGETFVPVCTCTESQEQRLWCLPFKYETPSNCLPA